LFHILSCKKYISVAIISLNMDVIIASLKLEEVSKTVEKVIIQAHILHDRVLSKDLIFVSYIYHSLFPRGSIQCN